MAFAGANIDSRCVAHHSVLALQPGCCSLFTATYKLLQASHYTLSRQLDLMKVNIPSGQSVEFPETSNVTRAAAGRRGTRRNHANFQPHFIFSPPVYENTILSSTVQVQVQPNKTMPSLSTAKPFVTKQNHPPTNPSLRAPGLSLTIVRLNPIRLRKPYLVQENS